MAELSLFTVAVLLSIIVIAAMIAGASLFSMCTTRQCKQCHRRILNGGYSCCLDCGRVYYRGELISSDRADSNLKLVNHELVSEAIRHSYAAGHHDGAGGIDYQANKQRREHRLRVEVDKAIARKGASAMRPPPPTPPSTRYTVY